MKNKLFFICLLFFVESHALSLVGYAEESQVVVSATGRVSVKPDMAEFDVVVKSDADTAERAVSETAAKFRTVQNMLRTAGISKEDASSVSYTVSPRLEWDQSLGKSLLKGYTARHTIKVTVRILEKIGRAIDAVVRGGADEVQTVNFSSSNFDSLRQKALADAVENARREAGIMARAAGGRIGQLIEVSINEPSIRVRTHMAGVAMKAAPSSAPTEIAPAEQDIAVTINSRWRFIAFSAK
ncbi:MAG: SIMPL domain-containing protein [Chlorobiaceae bacterium]